MQQGAWVGLGVVLVWMRKIGVQSTRMEGLET
jgi:hypothetical protein